MRRRPALGLLAALLASPASAQATCLTDAEIDAALGEAVRSGATTIDTRGLSDRPLCSGLTLAQRIQRMRAEAFPEEAARAAAARQAVIEREREAARLAAVPAPEPPPPIVAIDPLPNRAVPAHPPARVSAPRKAAQPSRVASRPSRQGVYYSSCRAARAAGAAPIRRGQPGYSARLDRDNDGIACE